MINRTPKGLSWRTFFILHFSFFIIHSSFSSAVAGWKPVPCPGSGSTLMTEWGEKVTPENAWREYPRPQMERAEWTNLNGLWEYAITSNATYTSVSPWDKFEPCREVVQKGEILVPFAIETPLSGVGRLLEPSEFLWYRRTIDVKKEAGRRILLNFGAVDFRCQVFIGHQEVTDVPHEGGLVPFSVDITDFVENGANELVVLVWDPTNRSLGACGKQVFNPRGCSYTRMSGIWQTVWMESVPATHIAGYKVVADIDKGEVTIKVKVEGEGEGRCAVTLYDADRNQVGELRRSPSPTSFTFRIPNARLWSPEDPYLYRFTATCGEDEVKGYFGMRKFEKRRDANGTWRFYLNNEPYFILGPLDQGWWPDGFLTPPSEAAMEFDIATLKKLGCNMMRKHMKDEPARYYYLCDKLGIAIVQDMAAGGGDRNLRYGFYRREFKEMVDYLCNFPSIVMWCPFNEDWGCQPGEFLTHNTLDWIRRYDPTRLVNGPSGWNDYEGGDFRLADGKVVRGASKHKPMPQCEAADSVDMHFYRGPGMHPLNDRRVSFLGEFGGLGHAVKGHQWNEAKSWGYGGTGDTATREGVEKIYLSLMDSLAGLAYAGLGGSVYTQTTDVELEINGYLTYDRKVLKFDAAKLRAAHEKVLKMAKLGATHRHVRREIFPKYDAKPDAWAYLTDDAAPEGWQRADFDDSAWKRSPGGFGGHGIEVHPAAKVKTPWTTKTLRVRKVFDLTPGGDVVSAVVEMFHDEDVTIYLNGRQVFAVGGFNTNYGMFSLDGDAVRAALRPGRNVFAAEVKQTTGGQYFDCSLALDFAE